MHGDAAPPPGGLPLAGVTVVSFEQAVALPYCTRMLGDLGAQVVKVEHPGGGDFTRAYDRSVHGLAAHYVWLNRNKRSLTLDLKHPRAAEVVERLLGSADVVGQNLAPGAADRLGIAATQVVARHPRTVAVDVSGYGTGGPLDHKRAYDLLVQAESGACSITGLPGAPAKAGPPMADLGTGMHAFGAVLAALVRRATTGAGAALSVAMFDVMADWMAFALLYTLGTGVERPPVGMGTPIVAPYGAYPTADGQTLVLGCTNDAEWRRLCQQVLGRPDLAEHPAFATNEQRSAPAARAEIDAAIAGWARGCTLADAQAAADAAGIGNARVNSVSDVITHPQLSERGRWQEVGSEAGPVLTLLAPPVSPGWEPRLDPIPALGADTDAVLEGVGYSPAEVQALRGDGVV